MEHLKRRADFVAAAAGRKVHAAPFMVQARDRRDRGAPRVGLTVTNRIGSAVERNRIRRRLRAAAEAVLARAGRPGFDYVLVARRPALTASFDAMLRELERALGRLHAATASGKGPVRRARPQARTGDGDADG